VGHHVVSKRKNPLRWRWFPIPISIVSLDEDVRYFAERLRNLFSKPQHEYFVTVLLNLALREGTRT
jgi:hypothetical protein